MERDFKGIWIPKDIWLSEDLGWTEKFLLTEIDSLAKNNECFATNDYFAKFFELSKDRVSKIISSLSAKGYVEVSLIYKEGTKQVEKRIITTMGYRRKNQEGIGENNDTPIGENNEDINTSIINTKNNKHDEYSPDFLEFWKQYPNNKDKKMAYKAFKSVIKIFPLQTILDGTVKYAKEVQGKEKKYIKHASTFLNNRIFLIEEEEEEEEKPIQPKQQTQQESVLADLWGDD